MMRGCSMRGGLLSVLSPRVCHGTSVVGIVPRWLVRSQPAALQVVRSNTTVAMGAADTLAEKEDTDTHSEHVFSHLRKYVTVTPWNFCHDIELLQVILEKAEQFIASDPIGMQSKHGLTPIPPELLEIYDDEHHSLSRGTVRLLDLDAQEERRNHREQLITYSRRLRHDLTVTGAYSRGRLRAWFIDERLNKHHTSPQCLMHFDLMSDPRTLIRPRSRQRPTSVTAVGDTDTHKLSIRSIVRHVLFRILPNGEGSWVDICREIERIASNSLELQMLRQRHQQFGPIADAPTTNTTPEYEIPESHRALSVHPATPPPFVLSTQMAQGRSQGLTYQRSVRAELSKFPEFVIRRKQRVALTSRVETQEIARMKMRATSLYGLDLDMLESLLLEEMSLAASKQPSGEFDQEKRRQRVKANASEKEAQRLFAKQEKAAMRQRIRTETQQRKKRLQKAIEDAVETPQTKEKSDSIAADTNAADEAPATQTSEAQASSKR